MIKTPSKRTFSAFIMLFICIIILSVSFRFLSHGINIDHIKIANIDIKGFYLKLNNKFILNIQEINLAAMLAQNANTESSFDIQQISDYVKHSIWGIAYFEQFHIEKIILNDEYIASIKYDGKQYALTFPKLKAIFDIQDKDNQIQLDIKSLALIQPDFNISGKLIYSLSDRQLGFGLILSPKADKNTKLYLQGSTNFKNIILKAKTSKIQNINFIYESLQANLATHTLEILDKWLFNALSYQSLEIKNASFNIALNKKNFLKTLLNNTQINLNITKPSYILDSSVLPINANSATISINKSKATLTLTAPTFDTIPLEHSKLEFFLQDEKPTLKINIHSDNIVYKESLKNLLAHFSVQIPLDTIKGDIKGDMQISLGFNPESHIDTAIYGDIEAQNTAIGISNMDFNAKQALVKIQINPIVGDNSILIDAKNVKYQNIFDIDIQSQISLLDRKIKASLFTHYLRVSTNPQVNQSLVSPQDLFKNIRSIDETLDSLESTNKTESNTDSSESTQPNEPKEATSAWLEKSIYEHIVAPLISASTTPSIAHYPKYAQNQAIYTDSTPATNESIQSESKQNTQAQDTQEETITLEKPQESSAPSEEIITFDDQDETTDDSKEGLDSRLESTKEPHIDSTLTSPKTPLDTASDITDKSEQNAQNQANTENINSLTKDDVIQDSRLESSTNTNQDIVATKPKATKQSLDFKKPMTPEETRQKIIELIKQQDENKFTYDVFKATQENFPKIDIEIDFSNSPIYVRIDQLKTFIEIAQNEVRFNIADFEAFMPYSPLMQFLGLSKGDALVYLKDANNFKFKVNIKNYPSFLLDKSGKAISNFTFRGEYAKDKLEIHSDDNLISLNLYDNTILATFKNIDISIDGLLQSQIPAIQEAFGTSNDKKAVFTKEQIQAESEFLRQKRRYERQHGIKPHIIAIEAENITGFFKEIVLPFDDFNAKIRDNRISADATYKNGIANIDIIHGNVLFKAGNFSGEFLNKVIKRQIVEGGLFELTGIYKQEVFNGEISIQNTSFKGFAIVQNVISLIDTIPSLVMFKNPNLGAKGYEVTKGKIIIGLNTQYVGLESINLIGKTMDVTGNGIIELDTQEVDIGLSISTLKSLSGILNKIPIAGYLILGKDGKVTTQVDIHGTLENPKTQISLAEDLLKTPLKIIQRVFTPIDIVVDEIRKGIEQ